ncbi:MAG: hypothetical protein ABI868_16440 [Acidobacteriota bacterium]
MGGQRRPSRVVENGHAGSDLVNASWRTPSSSSVGIIDFAQYRRRFREHRVFFQSLPLARFGNNFIHNVDPHGGLDYATSTHGLTQAGIIHEGVGGLPRIEGARDNDKVLVILPAPDSVRPDGLAPIGRHRAVVFWSPSGVVGYAVVDEDGRHSRLLRQSLAAS